MWSEANSLKSPPMLEGTWDGARYVSSERFQT
jgi:hypothetical protein